MQLLYEIHLASGSAWLPFLTKSFRALFAVTTDVHKARYLSAKYSRKKLLARAVRYPICTLPVLRLLEKWNSRGDNPVIAELPRRLVKGLTNAQCDVDMDLLRHLLDHHKASADSSNGYFLARAVFAHHLPLVDLLLEYGASPAMNDGWAVRNAISSGDLAMVKRLLELPIDRQEDILASDDAVDMGSPQECERPTKKKKRRKSSESNQARKRRRVSQEMRCQPTPKMLETAVREEQWQIVDYLTSRGSHFC